MLCVGFTFGRRSLALLTGHRYVRARISAHECVVTTVKEQAVQMTAAPSFQSDVSA